MDPAFTSQASHRAFAPKSHKANLLPDSLGDARPQRLVLRLPAPVVLGLGHGVPKVRRLPVAPAHVGPALLVPLGEILELERLGDVAVVVRLLLRLRVGPDL